MVEFLSAEWVRALDDAARSSPALVDGIGGDTFVLEQRVVMPAGGEAVHHLQFDAEGIRVVPGASARADVVLTTDLRTAALLARGETNAQGALAAGRLRVRGDLEALTSRSAALVAIGDVFASVRARTRFTADAAPGVGA